MLLAEEDIITRVESPLNLLNRLRAETTRVQRSGIISIPSDRSGSTIISPTTSSPQISADNLIDNLDQKLEAAGSKNKAMSVMNKALTRLELNVEALDVKRLPGVIKEMSQVVKNLEPEKEDKVNSVQFVVYSPTLVEESVFETVVAKD